MKECIPANGQQQTIGRAACTYSTANRTRAWPSDIQRYFVDIFSFKS